MPEKGRRLTHKTGKPKREAHVDVRMTDAQKEAIIRTARKSSLDPSTWMRSIALPLTDYNPDTDTQAIELARMKAKRHLSVVGPDTEEK